MTLNAEVVMVMSMDCSNYHNVNTGDAYYCKWCGKRLAALAEPAGREHATMLPAASQEPAPPISPAGAGDYVALTVFGVARVKVNPTAVIQLGQSLTDFEVAGQARALHTNMLNGLVTVNIPVVGTTLVTHAPGHDTIPVFISLC